MKNAGDGYFFLKNKEDPNGILDASGAGAQNGTNIIKNLNCRD
ncbi:hypothetical protein [Bacillus wiedmannii]